MLHHKDKKQAGLLRKVTLVGTALVVSVAVLGMNGFLHACAPAPTSAAVRAAAAWFQSAAAADQASTPAQGSPGRRGHSLSLMIFRLN